VGSGAGGAARGGYCCVAVGGLDGDNMRSIRNMLSWMSQEGGADGKAEQWQQQDDKEHTRMR